MLDWLKNAVFYEIYPQSFKDSNADGVGDINGIIEKLDYVKDLGATAIWLNPCFASPFYDAGYDVEDFYKVAPRYGTNEDLKRLFDEAHKKDLKIILDIVPGHTAVTCKWFLESSKDEKNEYTHRYIWTNSLGVRCTGIKEIEGELRGFCERSGCCAVNYFSTQPALNYGFYNITADWQHSVDSPEAMDTRNELINIMRFWLGLGCDGFRVDMAGYIIKNDDDEKCATIKFWQEVIAKIKEEYPNSAFVSEWCYPQYALMAGFDMDFILENPQSHYDDLYRKENSYFSKETKLFPTYWLDTYMKSLQLTKDKGYICYNTGNHDNFRMSRQLDENGMRLVYAFIMAMPGVPYIYNGDEIGMRYVEGLKSVEGGYHRTGTRTPMQWDDSKNAGFSDASKEELYIQIDEKNDRPTVKKQLSDKDSLLNEVKKLIEVRKSNKSLQADGRFEPVFIGEGYPFVFKRTLNDESILVCINPSDNDAVCEFTGSIDCVVYEYNGVTVQENNKLIVPAWSASYLKLNK
ncbi:MAG: glycosylase [Clostridia bacterium]|nr:glycosylase [Clostridia bacterium]